MTDVGNQCVFHHQVFAFNLLVVYLAPRSSLAECMYYECCSLITGRIEVVFILKIRLVLAVDLA